MARNPKKAIILHTFEIWSPGMHPSNFQLYGPGPDQDFYTADGTDSPGTLKF